MSNYLKLGIYFLICTFTLSACTSKSEKGKWTKEDMEKCIKEGTDELKEDESINEISVITGKSIEDIANCACKKIETMYESYAEADKKIESVSDEESVEIFADCFGFTDENGKWTQGTKDFFMQECNIEPGMEEICECALEKMEKNFTIIDIANLGNGDLEKQEELTQIYMDCFGSLMDNY